MFIHTVLWNFKNQDTKDQDFKLAKEKLINLKNYISELTEIDIAMANNINQDFQREILLITKFANEKDYIVYRDHEKHLEVKEYLDTVFKDRIVCDAQN